MHQTWSFAVKRAHYIVKYVNIYSQHLTSATVEPLLKVTDRFLLPVFRLEIQYMCDGNYSVHIQLKNCLIYMYTILIDV